MKFGPHEHVRRGQTPNDDWQTPTWIVKPLGHFDLDPCASTDQHHRTADTLWTVNDNGFMRSWVLKRPVMEDTAGSIVPCGCACHGTPEDYNGVADVNINSQQRLNTLGRRRHPRMDSAHGVASVHGTVPKRSKLLEDRIQSNAKNSSRKSSDTLDQVKAENGNASIPRSGIIKDANENCLCRGIGTGIYGSNAADGGETGVRTAVESDSLLRITLSHCPIHSVPEQYQQTLFQPAFNAIYEKGRDLEAGGFPINQSLPESKYIFRKCAKCTDCRLQEFKPRIFLNPPCGNKTVQWVRRLADHGDGIALVYARTDTPLFQEVIFVRATGLFFLKQRIFFIQRDGMPAKSSGGAPSVLVAFGEANMRALQLCRLKGMLVDLRLEGVATRYAKPTREERIWQNRNHLTTRLGVAPSSALIARLPLRRPR